MSVGLPPLQGSRVQRPDQARGLAFYDALFKLVCQIAASTIVLLAGLVVVVLLERSWLAIRTFGVSFLTQNDWNPIATPPVFGSLPFVYGTLITSFIAMLIAIPLGVGTAAYLSEIASGPTRRVASFFIEMLAAIPSVIYGFWGVFVLAPAISVVFRVLGSDNISGRGILSAGMILSIMIVPYIAAITYDVCQAVPRSQREASLALGATRWQTIWRVVLPYARPGIVAGAFLALGRALGETMAVTMLIGNKVGIENPIFGAGDSIASRLANQYMEADTRLFRSVLVELGLLLLVVTVILNTLARFLLARVGRRRAMFPFLEVFRMSKPAPPEEDNTSAAPAASGPNESRAVPPLGSPSPPVHSIADHKFAQRTNTIMTGVLGSCVLFTMSMLVLILGYLLYKGALSLDWQFFTELPPRTSAKTGGGLANAIVGSIAVVGYATLFAVPIGLLSAIYLAEYRPGPLAHTVRFVAEQLGGVPSIVVGIFANSVFTIISGWLGGRSGGQWHLFGWSGVFALAVMMIPIVLRAAEEALKLVPTTLRTASYALGSSQAQTILRITVPAALPAIITAIFLSVARIAGETAPLLLTAGSNSQWPRSMGDFVPTLPPYIFNYAMSVSENWNRLAWSGAFVLMVMVLFLNFAIRFVSGKRVVQASRAD